MYLNRMGSIQKMSFLIVYYVPKPGSRILHTLARKFAKTCTFCGREIAGYSHVIYLKHVTVIFNFPVTKRACCGEFSDGV